ncbi:right-handed parallel beta-helix repeat-containing protein [Methylomagnum ishizawai]|uniref:right-handed parallel beta-helix repeat-containing protein n=1 Tax=Methylomagnum ishizawai TaxID=1760988 RepID=UPI001C341B95|nr:right-handed parallel beta-helix repeat-containing protein [Methylomagnum ishizawai]BBL75631.1 hypothetical protein MishRS11D_27290 [Methylomagnum ishizawai]
METRHGSAIIQALAIYTASMAFAPSAQAATNTPLDCPGVIATPGGYRLTQNTACSFLWMRDANKIFDLNRFAFTGDITIHMSDQTTISNGTLRTNHTVWGCSNGGKLRNVRVVSAGTPSSWGTIDNASLVENSVFENIPATALGFGTWGGACRGYSGGTVRNSAFTGNNIAVISWRPDVLIEKNLFRRNSIGVGLHSGLEEDATNNMIRLNQFLNNRAGIHMENFDNGYRPLTLQGNQILKNQFYHNATSGIVIELNCGTPSGNAPAPCPGQGTLIAGNQLISNGFGSPPEFPNDDGVTARANIQGMNHPDGLVGITLSGNSADRNADLGLDVPGATDGGGNRARFNGNPAQCDGVVCSKR